MGMWHIWSRTDTHAAFWWGNLKERYHLENARIAGRMYNGSSRNIREGHELD
jgi:hypothetical protein